MRETVHLLQPPSPERLADFPTWHVHAGSGLCRATWVAYGPWWFNSDGQGRFDLPPPRGTCYLADDEIAALLEVLGPTTIVTPAWAERMHIWHVELPVHCRAADTTVRAARGFGVTGEISSHTPYDLSRQWAMALAAVGYEGIRYRLRHDPGGSRALALFGTAGERRRWRRGRSEPVSAELLDRMANESGVRVAPVPTAADVGGLLD